MHNFLFLFFFLVIWVGNAYLWKHLGKIEERRRTLLAIAVFLDSRLGLIDPHTATAEDVLNFEHETLTGLLRLINDSAAQKALGENVDLKDMRERTDLRHDEVDKIKAKRLAKQAAIAALTKDEERTKPHGTSGDINQT